MASNELTETNLFTHADTVCPGWQPTLHAERILHTLEQLSQQLQARKQAGAIIYPERPFRALPDFCHFS